MDFVNKITSSMNNNNNNNNNHSENQGNMGQNPNQNMAPNQGGQMQNQAQNQGGGGGFLSNFGGLGDKLNSAAGGGKESEKNEDYLDKGIDMFQEKVLKQGPQDNESAIEQAKDEQISDMIRQQYKGMTGKDIPIKDKPTTFG